MYCKENKQILTESNFERFSKDYNYIKTDFNWRNKLGLR